MFRISQERVFSCFHSTRFSSWCATGETRRSSKRQLSENSRKLPLFRARHKVAVEEFPVLRACSVFLSLRRKRLAWPRLERPILIYCGHEMRVKAAMMARPGLERTCFRTVTNVPACSGLTGHKKRRCDLRELPNSCFSCLTFLPIRPHSCHHECEQLERQGGPKRKLPGRSHDGLLLW